MEKEIESIQNPTIKHLVRLRQNRDYREEHNSVFIEGIKLVEEISQSHKVRTLITYDRNLIPNNSKSENTLIVSEAVMKKLSSMQHPEGLAAEIEMPKSHSLEKMKYVIVLDEINDPGNLGTLLRSALALGWQGAFVLDNSCDPYNDKALRAAKGATFRLPIRRGKWSDLIDLIKKNNLQAFVGDIQGKNIHEIGSNQKIALVLSNEAHGVSEEANKHCERITIPMSGKMESLNVAAAGAILMYVLKS